MIVSPNWEQASAGRSPRNTAGFQGHITDILGSLAEPGGRPQAFLVEQGPNWTLRTHYHRQHQFQVVINGSGTLGRHEIAPLMVHYTSPESGYGPIISGPEGVSYFTIRETGDKGAFYLPESRPQMQPGLAKAQVTSPRLGLASAQQLAALAAPSTRTAVEPTENGVAAWVLLVPPRAEVSLPRHLRNGGQFGLVCAGSADTGATQLGRLGMFHLEPEEAGSACRAGAEGLQLLLLQFPARLN